MAKQSASKLLASARNQIRGSAKPATTLGTLRGIIPEAELLEFVRWTGAVRRAGRPIFPGQYPNRISDLHSTPLLSAVSFRREVVWAGHLLQIHSAKLQHFILLARQFELASIDGDYDNCISILDQIEARLGFSFWTIENRIAILQLSAGLEKQKAYVASIRTALPKTNLVSFVSFHVSRRNENSTTPYRFTSQLAALRKSWALDPELDTYLKYRITNELPNTPPEIAYVLRYETTGAIVDYYEAFVKLAQHAVVKAISEASDTFISELCRLETLITNDYRLPKLLFVAGAHGDHLSHLPCRDLSADDAQVQGRIQEVPHLCGLSSGLDRLSASKWFLEGECINAGYTDSPMLSVRAQAVNFAYATGCHTDTMTAKIVDLTKLALNLRYMSFSYAFLDVVLREFVENPISARLANLLAFLNSPFLEPAFLRHLPTDETKLQLAQTLLTKNGLTPAIYFHITIAGLSKTLLQNGPAPHLSDEFTTHLLIEEAIRTLDFGAALSCIRNFKETNNLRFTRLLSRYEAHTLIHLNQFDELVDVIVARILNDLDLLRALPTSSCARFLNKINRRRLAGRLSTPIILDLHSRNFDNDYDLVRSYAYEDFLIAHNVDRPSQLAPRVNDFDKVQLVYYLRYICIPTVMQVSSAFQGTRELEEERLAVASLLIKLDPDQTKLYETEIREITRRQLIQRGLRHVEQSKIFVDLVAIRRWADNNIKEAFNRYQGLIKAGIGGDGAFVDALQDLLTGAPLPGEFLALPTNEASDLLIQIIVVLFRECLSNPQHGLDCYLSMRIRHGTLSGQLRSPLEFEKLITQREAGSQRYTTNTYWADRLSYVGVDERDNILKHLSSFSRRYDDFIERTTSELIRIRSADKPKGLLNVSVPSLRFRLFASHIKPDTTFELFLDACVQLFWQCVDDLLSAVRDIIDVDLKPEVNRLFWTLMSDIEGLGTTIPDLNRAVRTAQTGAQQALDRVKDWFRLPQTQLEPEFSLEEMVDIGLQCVQKIHLEFNPDVAISGPQLPRFASGSLTMFSDLFFIIFDNIRRHSGGLNRPKVSIQVSKVNERLRIIVSNAVGPGVRTSASENRVAKIKRIIAEGEYLTVVSSEGGTGLIKLRKIIGDDPKQLSHLDFGFTGDGRFFVDLEIAVRQVTI